MKTIEGNLTAKGLRIALVASRFNSFLVEQLVKGAQDAFARLGGDERGLTLVRVPGIDHLLLDETLHPFPQDWAAAAAHLRHRWGLGRDGAAGCIWWRETPEGLRMTPVVWVAEPGSTVLENACGSGALACACGLPRVRSHAEEKTVAILQPDDTPLFLRLRKKAHSWRADIGGDVLLIADGKAYWEDVDA